MLRVDLIFFVSVFHKGSNMYVSILLTHLSGIYVYIYYNPWINMTSVGQRESYIRWRSVHNDFSILKTYLKHAQTVHTICPRSLDPIHVVTWYVKWTKTFWTKSPRKIKIFRSFPHLFLCLSLGYSKCLT